jgi:2-oxo-4-hydroxy-4-carboxy-5-ureidoimidazoline decarboxylase
MGRASRFAAGGGVVPPEQLNGLSADELADALAPLFEGAVRFLGRMAAARPFAAPDDLFRRAREIAHAMPEAEQIELIDAHPRLGAPAGSVSPLSYVEQGYDREDADARAEVDRRRLADDLDQANAAYEARFGFRYCVFVAGRSREALLPDLRRALANERSAEIARAIDAVVDIAQDRYRKLTAVSR